MNYVDTTMSGGPEDRVVVLCTLRYSSNLGDGVIGDCLAHLIKKASPKRPILHLDMAGREAFASPNSIGSDTAAKATKSLFYLVPQPVRPMMTLLAWPILFRPRLNRAAKRLMPNAPFDLVFGGGQMLSDLALNFPLKFHHVTRQALAAGARIAVSGVGVSSRWSRIGRQLFVQALCGSEVCSVSVRDRRSRDRLEAHVPALGGKVGITVDPGVWAGEVYGIERRDGAEGGLVIGMSVAEPTELAAYADARGPFAEERQLSFWTELASTLSARGHIVQLFTNGAEEDEAFLDRVTERLTLQEVGFVRRSRAFTPAELADHFRNLDAIVSHRLHANIIAFSCAIPSVALIWDDKVLSFAEAAGREKWALAPGATAQQAADLVVDAAQAGVDIGVREELKARALADVHAMLASLTERRS